MRLHGNFDAGARRLQGEGPPSAGKPKQARLAVNDVQRPLFDIERGFSDSFAQGGMRMSGAANVFGAAAEFNHRNGFSD